MNNLLIDVYKLDILINQKYYNKNLSPNSQS